MAKKKSNRKAKPRPINNVSAVWKAIVETAGLDLKNYDGPFLTELATTLGISEKEFDSELLSKGVSIEVLIEAIIVGIAPYGSMIREILSFFSRYGARTSTECLRIEFDFQGVGKKLGFELNNFRDWEIKLREVITLIPVDDLSEIRAMQLRHAFLQENVTYQQSEDGWIDLEPENSDVAQWWTESQEKTNRIFPLPPPPDVRNKNVEKYLFRIWRYLRHIAARDQSNPNFVRSVVRGAYLRDLESESLETALDKVFDGVEEREVESNLLIEELMEILSLPVWKRRSELYSAWVGVRLMDAFGEKLRVHVADGSLEFSASGSHLATVSEQAGANLLVWCELCTPATNLVGKGRKRRIKPDYVVIKEPTSHADAAALVVECKQYQKQSRKNFAEAIVDYGRGHRAAKVLLVNYGPITSSVLEYVQELDAGVRSRSQVIGFFRPGMQDALDNFESAIGFLMQRDLDVKSTEFVDAPDLDKTRNQRAIETGKVSLVWTGFSDLDLHCLVESGIGTKFHVSYENLIWETDDARVELLCDITSGGEPEKIVWTGMSITKLDIWVNLYDGENFSETNACLTTLLGNQLCRFSPPRSPNRPWWRVLTLEPRNNCVTVFNTIEPEIKNE